MTPLAIGWMTLRLRSITPGMPLARGRNLTPAERLEALRAMADEEDAELIPFGHVRLIATEHDLDLMLEEWEASKRCQKPERR